MNVRPHFLLLSLLCCTVQASHAEDLTQTMISALAGGKPAGGMIFPNAYGWPGLHFAGAASQTAFMVLQHADQASQHKYLPAMRVAVHDNDALAAHLGMLEDRVRLADGKPQLYGSQLKGDPLSFEPIEDEANVDARPRSIGLEPLAEYAKNFGLNYTPKRAAP